jgi:hypothetical protein
MPNPVKKNESYVLNELWTRQLRWSKLSKQKKNQVYFGRLSALVILISGSVLQTYAQTAAAAVHEAVFKVFGSALVSTVPLIRESASLTVT